ncbi:MAG: hypothetical protein ACO3A2_01365 [Bdellovibrionia bacterium]
MTLTLITTLTISPRTNFQDISDAFSSNEVSITGLSALLFVLLLHWLNPLTSTRLQDLLSRDSMERQFLPGFFKGAFLAACLMVVFLLTGVYRYLGYFIPFEELPLELLNGVLRMSALMALVYCEEYLFRNRFIHELIGKFPPWLIAQYSALLYCGAKILQFDLGIMQLITLYLVSWSLFLRLHGGTRFAQGAGIWAAILIIFHPLLSLPIFGNEFSGILLIRFPKEWTHTAFRFLSGGAGGPLASFAFQLILIIDISQHLLRSKLKPLQKG